MKYFSTLILSLMVMTGYSQNYSACYKDLNYAGDTMVAHRLDIYIPKVVKPKYPAIVLLYGSAWFSNNSKGADMYTLGQALLDAGYAVVTPNHRTSGQAKFPAQINDIKAVVRFVRGTAPKYGIDTTFIGITGSSSGGNMAAMAGTTRHVKKHTLGHVTVDLEGNLGAYTSHGSSVDAVVDWFGPTNMLLMDSCGGTDFIHNDPNSPASQYIGGAIQSNREKTLLASPATYAAANNPPFLIFHGDADRVVPHCQSEFLYVALQNAKVPSRFYLVPGGQHGPGVHVEPYIKMMVDFFNTQKNKQLQ
ncbi:MAG TPA: alpha/beta hydrolase [Paludibacter sp.]|nr:alpha/beta hydrolase [Paludibacter sp.]